ncbi:MAG: LysR family transcriptional regulator [Burkholderiaceae bacterium]
MPLCPAVMPSRHLGYPLDAMNLSWLEDFVALASTGNFSRAADARHVTQPAFSRRIRALEEWLAVALVDRDVQPFVLTEAGFWFVNVAKDLLARVARLPADVRAVQDSRAATLHFAATHALSLTFVPSWLRGLEARVATAPIELMSDVLQRCEDSMLEQRVDFLLCHAHPQVPGRLDRRFPSATIGHDALLPVSAPAAKERRGTRGPRKPLHSLEAGVHGEVPILAFSAESGLGRIVSTLRGAALDKRNGRVVFTAHLATVLRSMALDGRGVAWLPRSLIEDDLKMRRLVAAAPMSWRIALEIRIFRTDGAQTPAAQAFWSAITSGGDVG